EITWKWVRGHAGDAGNERADALANKGVDSLYHSDAGSADRGRYS
ncbi:MAG: hypothetical protein HKO84_04605, partial [Pseudomonadales bacterium]|nr:hypothetical protein [Pseudomonadales bacterium]